MKTILQRTFSISLVLLLALALLPARSAQAKSVKDEVPVGLMQAVLDSTAQSFHAIAEGYTASASGLTFGLTAGGLQTQADGLQWGISLRGFGRADQVAEVSAPEIVQTGDKLEYRRTGLTEWYRDTALGLEQGFTIFQPPPGSGPLLLQLDLATGLKSVPDRDGDGLSFPGPNGQTLRYDHLLAWDANGVALNARLVSQPGQVILQVDDGAAAYPLTIDPLIYLQQKVLASDGAAYDFFGNSVALSGDTALVGAPLDQVGPNTDQGSAYVFVRSGITWTQQAKLTASDGAVGDMFGNSVALSGNTALVGAFHDTVGGNSDQGSAYIFVRNGSTWSQQAHLTASDGTVGDYFGSSVALSGDTALVGALGDDVGVNSAQGSAYVFVRSGTTWSQQAHLTASDGAAGDWFGNSVALSGDTALVGVPEANNSQGAAYVFVRSGSTWGQQEKLTASDGAAGDFFGASVALSGDTALVGAYGDTVEANNSQGAAYVFVRSGTTWTQQAELTASDGAAGDWFGNSVALSGDTALVGAYGDTVGANYDQGSAYVFVRNGVIWTQSMHLIASDGGEDDLFGNSVALSGDTALVGVAYDHVGSNIDQGSAYFYQAYRTDADLSVSAVRAGSAPLHAGDKILLTASVLNYGPASAPAVLLNVALPAGLTYVSHTATHGSYTPSLKSWSVGTLGLGVTASLTITVKVNALPASQTLTFAPFLLSRDINDLNNKASLALKVFIPHELALNGGFNTYVGTSKIPQYWTAVNFATTDGKDTATKKEGAASLKIVGTSGKTKTLTQTKSLNGASGHAFQFSLWVKGVSIPTAGLCQAQVLLYNGTTLKLTKTVTCPTGTYAFTKKSLSFTSTSVYTKAVIKITYAKASGAILFDGLSLMKAP